MEYSFIDLHIHTEHSKEYLCDDTVEEVLKRAEEVAKVSGKKALIAITDHNNVSGVVEAKNLLATGKYPHVQLISGAEFTVDISVLNNLFDNKTVFKKCHILAYGFDENDKALKEFCQKFQKRQRGPIPFDSLVWLISNAGGKLVLAHPGLLKMYSSKVIDQFFGKAAGGEKNERDTQILRNIPEGDFLLEYIYDFLQERSGGVMVGMERFHPDNYSNNFDRKIEDVCKKYNLVQTAGSDFHGYHLHTDFSIGNVFTKAFQQYYKNTLQDSTEYMNGIFVKHLPNIELLVGRERPSKKTTFANANGETITYDQYRILDDSFTRVLARQAKTNGSGRDFGTKAKKSDADKGKKSGGSAEYHRKVQKIKEEEADKQIREYI